MFRDNSLLPKETVRLAALGLLSENPATYAELAVAVRDFVERFADGLTGASLELLKYEGLVEPVDEGADPRLRLTPAGREELSNLLGARLRPPLTDLSKLVIALKIRFLALLDEEERRRQVDFMIEACEAEQQRLTELLQPGRQGSENTWFREWLLLDMNSINARLNWLNETRGRVGKSPRVETREAHPVC